MNIYVPDELHQKMQASDYSEINWSAVAQQAFEQELKVHAAKKGIKPMNTVIERLRASKKNVEDQSYVAGINDGRIWAEEHAQYDELTAVVEVHNGDTSIDGYSEVVGRILSEAGYQAEEVGDGWKPSMNWRAGLPPTPERYFEGWVEGAVAVFAEVEDEL